MPTKLLKARFLGGLGLTVRGDTFCLKYKHRMTVRGYFLFEIQTKDNAGSTYEHRMGALPEDKVVSARQRMDEQFFGIASDRFKNWHRAFWKISFMEHGSLDAPTPTAKQKAPNRFGGFLFVENTGVEPVTSCMPCKRSSQLS